MDRVSQVQWIQKDRLSGFMQGVLRMLPFMKPCQKGTMVWQSQTCTLKPYGLGPNFTSAVYCCVSLGKLPNFSVTVS